MYMGDFNGCLTHCGSTIILVQFFLYVQKVGEFTPTHPHDSAIAESYGKLLSKNDEITRGWKEYCDDDNNDNDGDLL